MANAVQVQAAIDRLKAQKVEVQSRGTAQKAEIDARTNGFIDEIDAKIATLTALLTA